MHPPRHRSPTSCPQRLHPACLAASLLRLAFGVVIAVAPAQAQTAPLHLPPGVSFGLRAWDTSSGLPQNSVLSLCQTGDGALWGATFGGLCRFDGRGWTVFDSANSSGLPDSRIVTLYEDQDGTLWIGSEHGVVSRMRGGRSERMADLPYTVQAITRLVDGRLVCADPRDVFVLAGGQPPRPLYERPLPHGARLLRLRNGDVWHLGMDGVRRLGADAAVTLFEGHCTDAKVSGDGTVFVATAKGLFSLTPGVGAPTIRAVPGAGQDRIEAMCVTRRGRLWCASRGRLDLLTADGTACELSLSLSAEINSLLEDSGGGIWIGFVGAGVVRLIGSELRRCDGLPDMAPGSVVGDGAGGWYVGFESGLYHGAGGHFEFAAATAGAARGLLREPDGTVWVGMDHGLGRLRAGELQSFGQNHAFGPIRAIERDAAGRIVFGTDAGAWRLDEATGECSQLAATATPGLAMVKCVRRDHDGNLWIAGSRELLCLSPAGAVVRRFALGADLPLGEVRAVLPRPNGRIWLGMYGAGFVALDGQRVRCVQQRQGLHDQFVCTVAAFGNQWIVGCNRGAYVVDPAALDRVADGHAGSLTCRPLTGPSELAVETNGGTQPCAWTQDGTTAICCVGGLVFADSGDLIAHKPPPVCTVDVVGGGDQRVEATDAGLAMHASRDRTVVVRLTAAELEFPDQLRYRWRLLPTQCDWTPAEHESTVTFSLPQSGDYRFEAQALGLDDRPSVRAAAIDIHIAPRAWERASFWLGAAVLAALSVWLSFRFGSRRARTRARRLEEVVAARTVELTQARANLERSVAERTIELQQALQQLAHDHEARVSLERELQKLQRMESLGQLAGGVAHDFNNLLTIVLGYEAMLSARLQDDPEMLAMVGHIREAGERGRRLTHHLLAVASRQTVSMSVIDLVREVGRQRGPLQAVLGPSVRLDLELPTEQLPIRAAQSQLEQVLMNLCVNARDALPGGGRVRIGLARRGVTVELTVVDDGVGMAPEVLHRAFEPFFTTKPAGRGMGLGLATVYGITKQLQGEVAVESRPGEGASFRFVFPLVEAWTDPARSVEVPKPDQAPVRVLLVEDQADVRRSLRKTLELEGCHVVAEAVCGQAAVRQLARHGSRIDVVLSDVQIPEPSGLRLVRALRTERPGVPIVFLTGHAGSWQVQNQCSALGIDVLPKPPDRGELMAALRRSCRGGAASGNQESVPGKA